MIYIKNVQLTHHPSRIISSPAREKNLQVEKH